MIQVVDLKDNPNDLEEFESEYELGNGQKIETEMAGAVGTKVFRVYRPRVLSFDSLGGSIKQFRCDFSKDDIDILNSKIEEWRRGGCLDLSRNTHAYCVAASTIRR